MTTPVSYDASSIALRRHPEGRVKVDDLKLVHAEISDDLAEGAVLVKNDFMQVTAVMADLMDASPDLPMPPYLPDQPLWGAAVGTVIASRNDKYTPGDVVSHMSGWRNSFVSDGSDLWPLAEGAYPEAYYSLNQGPTAYHGMVDVAEVGDGDVVFVSGAAGGVGSLAGQIAKRRGAKKVIGSAGTEEKVRYLVDVLGFDAAFNYKDGPVADQLRAQAPEGIDVFFDTVGGEQFEAAVPNAAQGARFALCGALSGQIGDSLGAFPRLDVMTAIVRQIKILPFATYHTPEQIWAWTQNYMQWLNEGKFVFPHTLIDGGLAAAPQALMDLLAGKHRGNVIVRL
jgi:NADPH-dependent curcumin reductase CurA